MSRKILNDLKKRKAMKKREIILYDRRFQKFKEEFHRKAEAIERVSEDEFKKRQIESAKNNVPRENLEGKL